MHLSLSLSLFLCATMISRVIRQKEFPPPSLSPPSHRMSELLFSLLPLSLSPNSNKYNTAAAAAATTNPDCVNCPHLLLLLVRQSFISLPDMIYSECSPPFSWKGYFLKTRKKESSLCVAMQNCVWVKEQVLVFMGLFLWVDFLCGSFSSFYYFISPF